MVCQTDFVPSVKSYREREGKNSKILQLLDNAPSHPPIEIINAIDSHFKIVYFPSNFTALIQPMDEGVTEKLERIKKQFLWRLLLADNAVAFSKRTLATR